MMNAQSAPSPFALGLERFCTDASVHDSVRGPVGLLMNRASVDRQLRLTHERIEAALPGQLACLFTPQHGWWGEQQANMIETPHDHAPMFRAPVYSLYAESRRPTTEMLAEIDHLIVDLQDVGVRVYTFVWTMLYCLQACAEAGVEVIVLDRPNPLGGEIIEGPRLNPTYRSFVGEASIPMRHGLTMGELAKWLTAHYQIDVALRVVPMSGWDRSSDFDQWDRPWLPPSPNLPTLRSTRLYPGQVLLEGCNISEGRGTTTPFELFGAPFIDPPSFAHACNQRELPGVRFLPTRFTPTFDKWQGISCGGVSIHCTDPLTFRSYSMTIALLQLCRERYGEQLQWIDPPYEYEPDHWPIDIISGDCRLREQLMDQSAAELAAVNDEDWRQATADARIYRSD